MAASPTVPPSVEIGENVARIRSRLVNGCLIGISVVALPALAASLSRIPDLGWLPPMGLHVALAAITIGLALGRKRLPFWIRAAWIIALFYLIGLGVLWQLGAMGASSIYFAAASSFAFLFFGIWPGSMTLALSIAALLVAFSLTRSGYLAPHTDPIGYLASPGAWIAAAGGLLLVVAALGTAISLFYRQLSASLRSESRERQRLNHLIEFAPDGILVSDAQGRLIQANTQCADLFGYACDELMGKSIKMLLPGILETWPEDDYDGIGSPPVRRPSLTGCRKDGTEVPLSATLVRLKGDNGASVVTIVHDLTDLHALQQPLWQAAKLEAIGNLTGGMAHDFNNYLTIIIGSLEFLGDQTRELPGATTHIDRARRAADRAADLTQSLLAFARRQPLAPQVIDIAVHINSTLGLVRPTITADVTIRVDLPPDLWPIRVDASQFDPCIVNIATNARDAMPDGGTLSVTARNAVLAGNPNDPDSPRGNFVVIEMTDSGIGMSEAVRAAAIEPFFSTKDAGHGVGLGLSMTHGFVTQSGGQIEIDSQPGQGTTVRLYLPRAEVPPAGVDLSAPGPVAPDVGATIMIVEDDENVREIVATHLWALGYDVIEAESGDLAWPLIDQDDLRIDVLFTDIVMSGELDGLALADRARTRRPNLPIVLTSGYPGAAAEGSSILAELPMLQKPYRREELAVAIREALAAAAA
ncbi:MAG: ATP-binding protein [Proteobacteria bacterium]|nr:ATP-binding protein [Pseudomonadota bacterium]